LSSRSFGNAPFANGVVVPKIGALYAAGKLYASVTERIIISVDNKEFDGADTAINVVYNLFSDVQLGLDAGAYICKESERSNYYATAKAVLAF
jgi:hypothetical protein